jgi:hypothetical protein
MELDEVTFTQTMVARFADPLEIVNLRFRVRRLSFDIAGTYLFALLVDDQEIAARRVRVYRKEGLS